MKNISLKLFVAVAATSIFFGCSKKELSDLSADAKLNKQSGPGDLNGLSLTLCEQRLVLTNGIAVDNLNELHEYVKNYGFTDDINGKPFVMKNGVLTLKCGGLLPDKTPILQRSRGFMAKVEAETEAYISSIFDYEGTDMVMKEYIRHLGVLSGNWLKTYALLFSSKQNDDGLYLWQEAHVKWFDEQFKQYNFYRSYAAYLMDTESRYRKLVKAYVPTFKKMFEDSEYGQDFLNAEYALADAYNWINNGVSVGLSIDAHFVNTYEKGMAVLSISDILKDKNGKIIGVLVNTGKESDPNNLEYMYIGYSIEDMGGLANKSAYGWKSQEANNSYNPWLLQPDYSILRPLAFGPPIFNPGGKEF